MENVLASPTLLLPSASCLPLLPPAFVLLLPSLPGQLKIRRVRPNLDFVAGLKKPFWAGILVTPGNFRRFYP